MPALRPIIPKIMLVLSSAYYSKFMPAYWAPAYLEETLPRNCNFPLPPPLSLSLFPSLFPSLPSLLSPLSLSLSSPLPPFPSLPPCLPLSLSLSLSLSQVIVLYNYESQGSQELSIEEGDIITVIGREDEVWWCGKLDKNTGMFPAAYVEPYDEV